MECLNCKYVGEKLIYCPRCGTRIKSEPIQDPNIYNIEIITKQNTNNTDTNLVNYDYYKACMVNYERQEQALIDDLDNLNSIFTGAPLRKIQRKDFPADYFYNLLVEYGIIKTQRKKKLYGSDNPFYDYNLSADKVLIETLCILGRNDINGRGRIFELDLSFPNIILFNKNPLFPFAKEFNIINKKNENTHYKEIVYLYVCEAIVKGINVTNEERLYENMKNYTKKEIIDYAKDKALYKEFIYED